jgi:K+-sensing histidine kinase KdpD
VERPDAQEDASRESVRKHLEFARNLHIDTRILEGEDAAAVLVDFARANKVTQIFVARPERTTWSAVVGRSLIQRIVRLARDMRVTVVSSRGGRSTRQQAPFSARPAPSTDPRNRN